MPPPRSGTATWAGAGTRSLRRPPARCVSFPPTRRSATSRTLRPRPSPPGWPTWPRLRVRRCSSPAVAPTRSTPPRRWRGATGSSASEPQRAILIRREKAYHGMHTAGTSLAGIPANAAGHGELIEDVTEVPWNDAEALRAAIERDDPERVAAFFCEPVIGAGRRLPSPAGLPPGRARGVSRDGRAVHRRRGHHRVRAHAATGSPRTASGSIPTSSRAPRASPAATCRWAR